MTDKKKRPGRTREFEYRLKRLDVFQTLGLAFIRYGSLVVIFATIGSALKQLAGKDTYADIFVGIFANAEISVYLSYAVGGSATIWALMERKLRGDKTREMASRIQELEQKIDPGRSSSHLTERGQTRPEDKQ